MPLTVITDLCVALVVSLGLGLVAWLAGRAGGRRWRTPAVIARTLAVPAGVAALHVWITGTPVWPPVGVTDRLLWAIVLVAVVGFAAIAPRSPVTLGLCTVIASAVALVVTLWPSLATESAARGAAIGFVIAGALLAGLSATALDVLTRRTARWPVAVIISGLGLAAGAALAGSGNMKLGQLGLGVGVASGAAGILLLRKTNSAALSSPVLASLALTDTMLVAGHRYGELTLGPMLVLSASAPAGVVASRLLRRWGPGRAGVAAVIVAGIIAAVGVFWAVDLTGAEALDEYPY